MSVQAIVLWLGFLVVAFVLILGYSTMSNIMTSGVVEDIENITDINASTDATGIISAQKTVWQYWLLFALLVFILFVMFMGKGD